MLGDYVNIKVKIVKCLSLVIDFSLKWNIHIDDIRIFSWVFFNNKFEKKYCLRSTLLMAYYVVTINNYPHIKYVLTVCVKSSDKKDAKGKRAYCSITEILIIQRSFQ